MRCPSRDIRLFPCSLALLVCAAAVPAAATAQVREDAAPPPADMIGTHEVRARWIHAEQRPDGTPAWPGTVELRIDIDGSVPGRAYRILAGPRLSGGGPALAGRLVIGGDGELRQAWIEPIVTYEPRRQSGDDLGPTFLSFRLAPGGVADLGDTRLWDIAPFEVPPLRPGGTSRDTLRLRAERFGFVQELEGPRTTVLLRDTVVDGARLWIGVDSARVRYRERIVEPRRTLDTLVVIERVGRGTLAGRFLYDPATGLFRARRDTLRVRGSATLRQPDGTTYRTGARLERMVDWRLRTPAEHVAWEEAREERGFSMIRLPTTARQERLAAGDTALADSLLRAWREASAVGVRTAIAADLEHAPAAYRARLDSLEIAEGGLPARLGRMVRRVWAGPPLDSAEMAQYLRLLRNPGLGFAMGLNLDPYYENLAGGLVMYPPTLGAPRSRTACTPAACRLLASERDAAEPRLRKTALVASFILEPERWADSLLSRSDTASHLLHPAVQLARGIGATWPAAQGVPIPPPGADWRSWTRWATGDPSAASAGDSAAVLDIRESHVYAVRMEERLTGRDIGAELARAAESAVRIGPHVVFRSLALRLGSIRPGLEEIAAGLVSPLPSERRLARIALRQRRDEWQAAEAATEEQVIGQLLQQVLSGDSLWSAGPEGSIPRAIDRAEGPPVYLDPSGIPPSVLQRWREAPGVRILDEEGWKAQPPREPGIHVSVGDVLELGPLVRVTESRVTRVRRDEHESPRGYASGRRYLLLRSPTGWRVVSVAEWVT